VPAGIPRTAGERFPAVEVGVRQGHAAAAANHSRPTAAMCSGTSCGLVLAAGDTAGIYCAAAGKRSIGSTAPAGTRCLFRTGGAVPAGNGDCLRRPAAAADGAELRKADGTVRQAFASRFQGKAAAVCPPVSHIGMHQVSDTAEKWLCLAAGATSTAISKSCLRRHHPAGNPQRTAVETVAIAAGKNCSGTGLSPLL